MDKIFLSSILAKKLFHSILIKKIIFSIMGYVKYFCKLFSLKSFYYKFHWIKGREIKKEINHFLLFIPHLKVESIYSYITNYIFNK